MSDDMRQQLEDAWPGMWTTPSERHAGEPTHTRIEHDYAAVFWRRGDGWYGELRVRSHHADVKIDQSEVLRDTPAAAARALRARAEILVDALERMEALDDEPNGLAALVGQWPGDETDEEINEALEDLS